MSTDESAQVYIVLTSLSSRMIHVGGLLTRTDRELRRAVNILGLEPDHINTPNYLGAPSSRPRPISPSDGGLQIQDAVAGSLHLLIQAYGDVLTLLTSKPLSALTTLITLGQSVGSVRLWPRHRHDPLEGISARQLLNMIKGSRADPAQFMRGQLASFEINVEPAEDEVLYDSENEGGGFVELTLPSVGMEIHSGRSNEVIITGRRITYIRKYPDGTSEVIHAEG